MSRLSTYPGVPGEDSASPISVSTLLDLLTRKFSISISKQTRPSAFVHTDALSTRVILAALQTPIVSMVIVRKPFQHLRESIADVCPHSGVGD